MQWTKLPILLGMAAIVAGCGGGGGGGDDTVIAPFWNQTGLVVADLNADGRADVALAASYIDRPPPHAGYVEVYLQTPAGGFSAPLRYAVGPDPWGLSVGDVNGDGRADLVAASPSTIAPQFNVIDDSGGVSVLRQDVANPGAFLAAQWLPTGGAAQDAAIAQLDGVGPGDIAVADGVNVNSRALLLLQNPAAPGQFFAPTSLPTASASGSEDVAVGDVNGDGRSDIVLAASNNVVVFVQRAAGGFEAPALLAAGLRTQGVAIADLDGDGRADIVAVNAGNAPAGFTGGASVTILRQTGPGIFVPGTVALPDGARRAAIGDLDGDGAADIAVVSIVYQALFTPSTVSVLLQSRTSRGQFALAGSYPASANAGFVAVGDIDGDGRNDIVVNDGPAVLLQRAGAPGTFDAVRPLP